MTRPAMKLRLTSGKDRHLRERRFYHDPFELVADLPIRKSRALSGRSRRGSNFKLFFGGQFYPMLCALTKVFPVCFIVRARGIPFTLASVF